MKTDGNLDAIERELAAQERYDAAQKSDFMFCRECNEIFSECEEFFDVPEGTCPHCKSELAEMK